MQPTKPKRINNNTQSLKKAFPEVYRDFFSQNPLVTSASGVTYFTGEHFVMYGGLAIAQKLPIKVYVGLENIENGSFEISSLKSFDIIQQNWEDSSNLNAVKTGKMAEVVKKELEIIGSNKGYRVNILSEVPLKCGMTSTGAFCGALAAGILIDNKVLSHDDIKNFEKLPLKELAKNEKFDRLFRFAWKLDSVFHADASSGIGPYCALVNSNFPVVYFTEKRGGSDHSPERHAPLFLGGNYDIIDKLKYWGFRMNELMETRPDFAWPIDFGLIFSGNISSIDLVIRTVDSNKDSIEQTVSQINPILEKHIDKDHKSNVLFFDLLADSRKEGYWESIVHSANEVSLECLGSLSKLFRQRIDRDDLEDFFRSINHYHNMLEFFKITSPSINRIQSHINYKANLIDQSTGGSSKLTGSGKGGDVLFVVPYGNFSDTIDEIVGDLNNELQRDISLDYASWIDGTESKGLEINQDLHSKVYSAYVSRGSVVLDNFIENRRFTEILTLDEFEEKKKSIDILIDTVNEDIWISNKLMTSKDIHSATTTGKVLVKLLENSGRGISNKELEASSYTEDRNEFQSKIISPLRKAIKKHRKKDLDFSITGGLVNFQIDLNIDGLHFAIIRKIT